MYHQRALLYSIIPISRILLLLLGCFYIGQDVKGQIQIAPSDDCYIYAAGPRAAETYGVIDPDSLKTRKSVAGDQFTRETYIKFNLGDRDTTYLSATVKLYGIVEESKRMQIFFTDTSWSELTLTGNTRPSGTYITDLVVAAGEGYYSWDVTAYMNSALAKGRHEVAFILKDLAGAVSTKDTRWHSKENASGNHPVLELVEGQPVIHRVGAYYIDNIAGDDANSGATPSEAWKSLEKIDSTVFGPGDSILFKAGVSWKGQLRFRGSGSAGKPIIIGKYGDGNNPVIEGQGLVQNTVQLISQQYIEIQDLHITNMGASIDFRRGIFISGEDMGAVRHIFLRRLEISDINGSMDGETSKNNGGVFFEISGSNTPTFFDTLVVEDCYIHDVDRTGISNRSSWADRTLTTDGNWTPSKNMIIRNNVFENTGANALIVRVAYKPLIEYNLFTHCSTKGSGNACFSFNTNYATWQFNEACYTQFNSGDEDAAGFDSDYNSKFTLFQYNYSHNNGYGGILVTGGPGDGFNDGTIIRYNILANNADHVFRTSGSATNTKIYNNTIYSRPGIMNLSLMWHKSWEGYSSNTQYMNNIFQVMGTGTTVDLGSSTGNVFNYNLFYGPAMLNEPADLHKINIDPMLTSPDSLGNLSESSIDYSINKYSPAINSGMVILDSPSTDYEGNAVPTYGIPDRGALEYTGPTSISEPSGLKTLSVYPNPAHEYIQVSANNISARMADVSLYSSDNRLQYSKTFAVSGNSLDLQINLVELHLSPGSYLLLISYEGSGRLHSTVVID